MPCIAGSETKPEFFTHANYFIGANLFRLLEEKMAKGDVAKMTEAAGEILPYLNTAVEMKIPSEDAYVMLGNCHVYLKEYDKAMQTYQQLMRAVSPVAAAEKLPGFHAGTAKNAAAGGENEKETLSIHCRIRLVF